jgi:nucleotide-binding universal stress UspA family protein
MAFAPSRPGERELRTAHGTKHRSGTFARIVVPVGPEEPPPLRAVEAAARIAAERATVVLVCVLDVPRELPLDALFPEEEAAARAVLRRAAAVVERYGIHVVQRVERSYSAAPAVLALADEYRADLIVLGTTLRMRRGRSVFDATVTSILHRATCRVMLVTRPTAVTRWRP